MKKIISAAIILSGSLALSATAHDHSMKGVDAAQKVNAKTGMRLTKGFHADVFADDLGAIRHIVSHKSGWVYVSVVKSRNGGETHGLIGLKDSDGDGKADVTRKYAEGLFGTGLALLDDTLYFGADKKIIRYGLSDKGEIVDAGDVIVDGFTLNRQHDAKSLTVDVRHNVYVNFGVPSNACMEKMRTKGSPGQTPCKILENYGGVWKFDGKKLGQTQKDGVKYSTGHRNAVAIEWDRVTQGLFLVQHGRDQLNYMFPDMFSKQESAELPAEEFHRVRKGDDLGWPYSYYDHKVGKRIQMPEYGGDGKKIAKGKKPLIGFPAHWAPNDLLFPNHQTGLPRGALIAFHGSWNRGKAQRGYRVVFVPMDKAGNVKGQWVTFADGFANPEGKGEEVNNVASPRNAKHRPMGLANGQDGTIYITSRTGGRIWQVKHD